LPYSVVNIFWDSNHRTHGTNKTLKVVQLILILTTLQVPTACIFDKAAGQMYLQQETIFKREMTTYQLEDIQEVKVVEETDASGDKTGQIKAILVSGIAIPIADLSVGQEDLKIVRFINHFLDIKTA